MKQFFTPQQRERLLARRREQARLTRFEKRNLRDNGRRDWDPYRPPDEILRLLSSDRLYGDGKYPLFEFEIRDKLKVRPARIPPEAPVRNGHGWPRVNVSGGFESVVIWRESCQF